MVSIANKAAKVIHAVVDVFAWLCAFLLFAMAFISFIDCIMRYFFGHSIRGAQELVELSLCVLVYSGLAAVIMKRGGIQIPLVTDALPLRGKYILRFCTDILSFAVLVLLAWQVIGTAGSVKLTTSTLLIPHAPIYYYAAFGSLLACLEFIIHLVEDVYYVVTGDFPETRKADEGKGAG